MGTGWTGRIFTLRSLLASGLSLAGSFQALAVGEPVTASTYAQRLAAYGWDLPDLSKLQQSGLIDASLRETLERRMTDGDFPGAVRIAESAFAGQRADDQPAAAAIWFRWAQADRDGAIRTAAQILQQTGGPSGSLRVPKAWDGIGAALAIAEAPDKIQWLRERLTFTASATDSGGALLGGLMTPWLLAGNFDVADLMSYQTDEPARVQVMTACYLGLLHGSYASQLEERPALFRRVAASIWHWRRRDHSFPDCTSPDVLLAAELGQVSRQYFGPDPRPAGVELPASRELDPDAMASWTEAVLRETPR